MNRKKNIEFPKEEIKKFCRTNHIRKLSVFGSALRDNFSPESDIDLLVEFESGHIPGFFKFVKMGDELSTILGGRKVDLRTPEDLSRYFRDEVLEMAEVQYAQ